MRKLSAHPAMNWDILGKVVESIEIGPPDDVVLAFVDGARLILSGASVNAELPPFRGPLATQPAPRERPDSDAGASSGRTVPTRSAGRPT